MHHLILGAEYRGVPGSGYQTRAMPASHGLNNTGRRVVVSKGRRGFASMDPSKRREIASKGGKAAHEKGVAHEGTTEEAREAGRIGGIRKRERKPAKGFP